MAKTIGQLTQATTIAGGDEFVIEQSGLTKRVAASVVRGGLVNADIDAAAAIAFSKLAALDDANILVGNGSNVATKVAVTGDVTISNAGVTAIAAGAVVTADLADAAITAPKLSGAQTGSAPIYGCRAWVNFDGNFTAVTGNSYTRTGTAVEVTKSAHGLATGNKLVIASATDSGLNTAADTASAEITVTGANTFTFQTASTGTASGTLSYALGIRASGNVASVLKNATGDYTITFSASMADANYAVNATTSGFPAVTNFNVTVNAPHEVAASASQIRMQVAAADTGAAGDPSSLSVSIFR